MSLYKKQIMTGLQLAKKMYLQRPISQNPELAECPQLTDGCSSPVDKAFELKGAGMTLIQKCWHFSDQ